MVPQLGPKNVSSWWDLSLAASKSSPKARKARDLKSSNTNLWVTGLMQHSLGLTVLITKTSWKLISHVCRCNLAYLTIRPDSTPLASQLDMPSLWPLKTLTLCPGPQPLPLPLSLCFPTPDSALQLMSLCRRPRGVSVTDCQILDQRWSTPRKLRALANMISTSPQIKWQSKRVFADDSLFKAWGGCKKQNRL